jgi:hypothetical protein
MTSWSQCAAAIAVLTRPARNLDAGEAGPVKLFIASREAPGGIPTASHRKQTASYRKQIVQPFPTLAGLVTKQIHNRLPDRYVACES